VHSSDSKRGNVVTVSVFVVVEPVCVVIVAVEEIQVVVEPECVVVLVVSVAVSMIVSVLLCVEVAVVVEPE